MWCSMPQAILGSIAMPSESTISFSMSSPFLTMCRPILRPRGVRFTPSRGLYFTYLSFSSLLSIWTALGGATFSFWDMVDIFTGDSPVSSSIHIASRYSSVCSVPTGVVYRTLHREEFKVSYSTFA